MKLQLALDHFDSIQQAISLLDQVVDLVDIVEVGTPMIIQEGVSALKQIKSAYPQVKLLADLKIVDAGALEARLAFEAGADIVTVLGLAHDVTIQNAVCEGVNFAKQIMVDLISVSDIATRSKEVDALGVDYICAHTAFDMQGTEDPLGDLPLVMASTENARVAVAGGINPATLQHIVPYRPEIVVVGGYITSSLNSRKAALEINQLLAQQSHHR